MLINKNKFKKEKKRRICQLLMIDSTKNQNNVTGDRIKPLVCDAAVGTPHEHNNE